MRWWILIVALLLITLTICGVAIGRLLFEPSYQGKPLSQWLTDFDSRQASQRAEAVDAVRHMGKRAVPFLSERLRQRIPAWKIKVVQLLSRQRIIRFRLGVMNESGINAARRQAQVLAACDALGPAAGGALPALEEALYSSRDFDAAYALARVGPEAVPALTRASTSNDYFVHVCARYFLELLRNDPELLANESQIGFFQRSNALEKRMLANWLPKAELAPRDSVGKSRTNTASTAEARK